MNPAFELHHVGVRLGGWDILYDLSLSIPADRTTAIIGPTSFRQWVEEELQPALAG